MDNIVFYSWQSDSLAKINRFFIRDCLTETLKKINKNSNMMEAVRLDHDTANIPGTPDIANTIFEKIRESSVFIADLTLLAETKNGKKSPNPNVLIELGYAFSAITGSKIITIINTSFGEAKQLPFDLLHKRWPIQYSLTEDDFADKVKVNNVKKALSDALYNAIQLVLDGHENSLTKLPSFIGTPSFRYIQESILSADPQDQWEKLSDSYSSLAVYKNDVNLRLIIEYSDEGIQCRNFKEEWANRHPDPHATGYWCKIYYGSSYISRSILVSVDGGRALLPVPMQKGIDEKLSEVLPFNYRIAQIFDSMKSLDQYMFRSKLTIAFSNGGVDEQ